MMDLFKEIEQGIVKDTGAKKKLTVAGKPGLYPVYSVPLGALYYNDQNNRIATWIERYKRDHGIQQLDRKDIDAYNEIIEGFIRKSNEDRINKTKNNIELVGQQESGITMCDGRVVDGNRRFTCLRLLAREKGPKYGYFETVILPAGQQGAKEIKMLELNIQQGKEDRVDYDPIDRLAGMYHDIIQEKLLTVHEYALSVNLKDSDIEKDLAMAQLLVEYLEFIKEPEGFYIAREEKLDGPLREMFILLNAEKNEQRVEEIKPVLFTQLALCKGGDVTRYMRNIKKIIKDKHQGRAFVTQQQELAADFVDAMDDAESERKARGIEVVKKLRETKLRENAEDAKKVAEAKIFAQETRNRPLAILRKGLDTIDEIDERIFAKLSEDDIVELLACINELEARLAGLKAAAEEPSDVH